MTPRARFFRELASASALATSLGGSALAAALIPLPLLLDSLSLSLVAGALLGACFGLLRVLIASRCSARMARLFWIALGAAIGAYCAAELGAFAKLASPRRAMAVGTIATGVAFGAVLGALVAKLQPARDSQATLLTGRPLARGLCAALLAMLALAGATYDVTAIWLATYPAARQALFASALLCAASSVLLVLEALPRARGRLVPAFLLGTVALGAARLAATSPEHFGRLARTAHTEHWMALIRRATDLDRDGHSSVFGGGDCAPFDASVHPAAREIPGNGVDDNCRHGDAPSRQPLPKLQAAPSAAPPAMNLVLVTIDSLRPDRTTPYGHFRDTTPVLAKLAEKGLRFENAYTSGGWTCLAMPSLMSGVYPRRLSWKTWFSPYGAVFTLPADPRPFSIQAALRQRGYRTLFVLSGWMKEVVVGYMRLDWDTFVLAELSDDRSVTGAAARALEATVDGAPFFLWVHYFNIHADQTYHAGVPTFGRTLEDRYDHEVLSVDRELGNLFTALERESGRPTAIVVTADHGEALVQSAQIHGADLLDDSVRIPMLLRAPGVRPGVVQTPVSLVDIVPTLLALAGAPLPEGLDGEDLRSVKGERSVITDLWRFDSAGRVFLDQISVSSLHHRLLRNRLLDTTQLIRAGDRSRPPRELELASAPAELVSTLDRYSDYGGGP